MWALFWLLGQCRSCDVQTLEHDVVRCVSPAGPARRQHRAQHTMRVQLIGHFQPRMTDMLLHIDARMADYMAPHPYGCVGNSSVLRASQSRSISVTHGFSTAGCMRTDRSAPATPSGVQPSTAMHDARLGMTGIRSATAAIYIDTGACTDNPTCAQSFCR